MAKIHDLKNQNKRIIGMWGYPDPEVLEKIQQQYSGHEFVDLDVNFGAPSSNVVPDAYCKIIANIVDNAITLKDKTDLIIASVGEEKCDSARIAALILEDLGFKVIQTKYAEYGDAISPTPIATSNLPLKEKVTTIMDGVVQPVNMQIQQSKATMGFWGVPPNDLSLLELFPDTTHVFGWTRCVEAKRPADLELEMMVDESIPTVFFAQTFCAKMQLAQYLARKYNGLFVDVDDTASNSVRAKIEAFIRLG
ncbi:MAG: hypothetical protein ACD_20C00203G0024 [uncultured bacterium]|nr:MAG: hypothetical protein ACD_20C00203G0024 [uncultured bacterium]